MKWRPLIPIPPRPLGRAALLFAIGAALTLCFFQAEFIWLPKPLDSAGQILYRIAFLLTVPVWMCTLAIRDPDIQYSPLLHSVFVAMASPFVYYALWRARVRVIQRLRRSPQGPEGPTPSTPPNSKSISRRLFLSETAGRTVLAGAGVVSVYSFLIEPRRLAVREYDIPIEGLPSELSGLKIAHISDTHYGPYVTLRYLEEMIRRANALQPDLIALTGDYVHRLRKTIEPRVRVLAGLKARLGIVAVLGNHDHYLGRERCKFELKALGFPLLDNGRVYISSEGLDSQPSDGRVLCLAGVGDLWEDRISFKSALSGVEPDVPRLLLSHNPDVAEIVPPNVRVDLMLSGHTHGGQISVPMLPAYAPTSYGDKYLGGLCQGPGGPVIVSRGVGMTGLPVRFRVRPEIGLIRLRQYNSKDEGLKSGRR